MHILLEVIWSGTMKLVLSRGSNKYRHELIEISVADGITMARLTRASPTIKMSLPI